MIRIGSVADLSVKWPIVPAVMIWAFIDAEGLGMGRVRLVIATPARGLAIFEVCKESD